MCVEKVSVHGILFVSFVKWIMKDGDGCKTWLAVVVVEPRVDNKDVHIQIS